MSRLFSYLNIIPQSIKHMEKTLHVNLDGNEGRSQSSHPIVSRFLKSTSFMIQY